MKTIVILIIMVVVIVAYKSYIYIDKISNPKFKRDDCVLYDNKYMKVRKVGEDSYVMCTYDNPTKCILATKEHVEISAKRVDCLDKLYKEE